MREHTGLCRLVIVITMFCPGAWAQQPAGAPGSSSAPSTTDAGQAPADTSDAAAPDTRPLSGPEEITVGLRHGARNYVLPSLQVNVYGDSNQISAVGGTRGLGMTGSVTGRLALQHVTRKNQLTIDYMAGGLLYSRNSDFNTMIHQFGITESIKGRRWELMLGDRASYLPESAFGFYGFGGLGLGVGSNLGNLNPNFSTNQTLFSSRGDRISNVTVAQVSYLASARSSFAVSGSYGLLRFLNSDGIESDHRMYTASYNYLLTRKDSLGIVYGYGQFRFRGVGFGIDDHFLQLSYGRRITGRMAFEVAAGPMVDVFRNFATASQRRYAWNAHSSLRYRLPRADLGFSYGHFTTNGSGVLFGAETDQFSGTIGVRLTRNWSGSIDPGYAHNTRLRQTTTGNASVSFDSVYGGFSLRRSLGRYMDTSFRYSIQDQRVSLSGTPGIGGGNTFVRHLFGVGFNWHTRPYDFD
jgi:hypothetical protein